MSAPGTSGNYTAAQLLAIKNEVTNDTLSLGYNVGGAGFLSFTDWTSLSVLLNALRDGVTAPVVNSVNQPVGPSGAITGATNAAPIVITSAGHGRTTGDQVVISGVVGNTAANNTTPTSNPNNNPAWTITVVDANTFSLNGSAGNGAYTSGGTWTWCVQKLANGTTVRNATIKTGDYVGAVTLSDMPGFGSVASLTGDDAAKLAYFTAAANQSGGNIPMTNPDGSESNAAANIKSVFVAGSASAKAVKALENRFGSRIEQLLNMVGLSPGVLVTPTDVKAANDGHY